jgi:hypothetical protein
MAERFQNNKRLTFAALAVATLALSACGTESKKAAEAALNCGQGKVCGAITQAQSGLLGAILGTYQGEMVNQGVRMSATMTLSKRDAQVMDPVTGRQVTATYAFVDFEATPLNASGVAANFHSFLGMDKNGDPSLALANAYDYSFYNYQIPAQGFSDSMIGFSVDLVIQAQNNQMYPAQSLISIKSCGLSKDVCTNPLWDVSFPNGFVKR